MFLLGLAGFTLTNMLCGLATSAVVLVIARVVQGATAALLVPQVLGAMPTLFDDARGLARAMSAYGVMMGVCLVLLVLAWTLIWRYSTIAAGCSRTSMGFTASKTASSFRSGMRPASALIRC